MTLARVFADGRLVIAGKTYRAALGRGGIVPHKQEGDGGTPAGLLPLRKILYRADRIPRPQAAVPVEPIAPTDGWCDDPSHADYNRMVRLPHEGRHEDLWRRDTLYDLVGILGWNDRPVQRGRGSAIFLHVAQPDGAPTEGCVAMAYRDLVEVIATLTGLEIG